MASTTEGLYVPLTTFRNSVFYARNIILSPTPSFQTQRKSIAELQKMLNEAKTYKKSPSGYLVDVLTSDIATLLDQFIRLILVEDDDAAISNRAAFFVGCSELLRVCAEPDKPNQVVKGIIHKGDSAQQNSGCFSCESM